MDSDIWRRCLSLLLLLLGAMYCASAEIAYASLNRIRAKNAADHGNRRAKRALDILEDFDQALTTLLIGNNITHIGFATLSTVIATKLWGVGSVKYVTMASTLIIFFFSELIPKSYAKSNYSYALLISGSLRVLMTLFKPLAWFFTKISSFISRFFKEDNIPDITEEEFYAILETAGNEGVLEEDTQKLVDSAVDFDVKLVKDLFRPLDEIEMVNVKADQEEILAQIQATAYSRLPIYRGQKENVIGILHTKTYLRQQIKGESLNLYRMMRKPVYVRWDMPADEVLRTMSGSRNHIAIVKGDSVNVVGIISMEDILESLVGEIWDEQDRKVLQEAGQA